MVRALEYVIVGEEKLHCASCEQRVHRVLRRVPGVQDVQASAETQRIRVVVDPAVDSGRVGDELRQIGYQVAPAGGVP